ncbi:MAG: M15 family metallopeptidase [Christensenellales bacterium]|jgi:D-alanyl-D-alanine carboxypeptidase
MPGNYSEHATGLAVDILSASYAPLDEGFAQTEEGAWLANNAHRFGFILRYPKSKESVTGVVYEPWHFRYVGVEAASEIFQRDICLEEYLLNR